MCASRASVRLADTNCEKECETDSSCILNEPMPHVRCDSVMRSGVDDCVCQWNDWYSVQTMTVAASAMLRTVGPHGHAGSKSSGCTRGCTCIGHGPSVLTAPILKLGTTAIDAARLHHFDTVHIDTLLAQDTSLHASRHDQACDATCSPLALVLAELAASQREIVTSAVVHT